LITTEAEGKIGLLVPKDNAVEAAAVYGLPTKLLSTFRHSAKESCSQAQQDDKRHLMNEGLIIDGMSQPDDSTSGQMALFNADQLRWATRIPLKVPSPDPEWLKPIWRDAKGEHQYCHFKLIRRKFGKAKIHELIFTYAGQHDFDYWHWCDWDSGVYFRDGLTSFFRDGWPQPTEGGAMERRNTPDGRPICRVIIYCDDLFLCPECGEFRLPREQVVSDEWVRIDSIDHRGLCEFIQQNQHRPEFQLKACGDSYCAEHRARVMQELNEADREAMKKPAFVAESPQARPIVTVPPESRRPAAKSDQVIEDQPTAQPEEAQPAALDCWVYVIGGEGYFKIGFTTNDVNKRVKGVQTSCPFLVSVVKAWKHHAPVRMETLLHEKYREFNSSGEWFELSSEHVQAILKADTIEDLLSESK